MASTAFTKIAHLHRNNVQTFKNAHLAEVSGALGDLGTLLPLMIALAVNNSINLSSTLVISGLWNILTGVFFGIPLPVQPMKAIAAVAISRHFSLTETISAGFTVSGIILLFSITGLLQWFTHRIPIPVVKGIQVGAGLSLILSAGSSLLQPLSWTTPSPYDNLILGLVAFFLLLSTHTLSRFPYALIIFLLSVLISIILTPISNLPSLTLYRPALYLPTPPSFLTGALQAGLGQLPLTTLNSIIAVSFLSSDLLPHLPTPSVTAIGLSVAVMNLVGGWFGAMPVCHGSGGLAAQYRFGARSGASIIILGSVKIVLGLLFASSLVALLGKFPRSLLGIMVIAAGLELVGTGESFNCGARDLWVLREGEGRTEGGLKQRELSERERKERWTVMSMTVAGMLAFRNNGIGFVAGMMCFCSYRLPGWWKEWRRKRRYGVENEAEHLLSS